MKRLFINGRFLGKPVTGVERFAREIVAALDILLAEQEDGPEVVILAPIGTPAPETLKKIKFRTCGTHQGHLWEQWDLWRAARGGALLSLCNCGPVLHADHLVVIHDALVYRMPQDYSLPYRLVHQTLGRVLARHARLASVSDFSRRELAEVLGVPAEDILLIPNGHEHILRHAPDERILDKLGLNERKFFLFVGSPAPRKNLARAIEAFAALERPDITFVIVGVGNAKVFKQSGRPVPNNVIQPGRLDDQEIVALYRHAEALVFPSLYEGFGIPPLEAMVHGCPVIAADIPPVREVCGDAVLYVDPLNVEAMTRGMQQLLTSPELRENLAHTGNKRYAQFSWKSSSNTLNSWWLHT